MAFIQRNFVIGSTGGYDTEAPQNWNYKSEDDVATMSASGYFNDARPLPNLGDTIYLNDTVTPAGQLVRVTQVTPNVEVSAGVAI